MPEDGVAILLALQLFASIAAAIAWWRAGRQPGLKNMRAAAYLTCAWFAVFAALVAFLFDTGLVRFIPDH